MAPDPSANNKKTSRYPSGRRWTVIRILSAAFVFAARIRPIHSFRIPIGSASRAGNFRGPRSKKEIRSGAMGLPSALGIAAGTVGRRSTRIRMIREAAVAASSTGAAAAAAAASLSSSSSAKPKRAVKARAVPVTPSPKKRRRQTRSTPLANEVAEAVAPKRAPNRQSRGASSAPVAKRRLSLAESDNNHNNNSNIDNNDNSLGIEDDGLELTTDMVAAINPSQEFIDLGVPPEELRPSNTLTTGQCFHWKVVHPSKNDIRDDNNDNNNNNKNTPKDATSAWGTHDATEWVGVLRLRLFGSRHSAVIVVRELPETTLYRPLVVVCEEDGDNSNSNDNNNVANDNPSPSEMRDELGRALRDYFQLGDDGNDNETDARNETGAVSLRELYEEWSGACPRLATIAGCLPGVRIIRQDPWECLVSFVCSSNNNIPRITKMLASIRKEYGRPLLRIPSPAVSAAAADTDSDTDSDTDTDTDASPPKHRCYYQFYSFPSLDRLSALATDEDLRGTCGMGYRAGYVLDTMAILKDKGGEAYLEDTLRAIPDQADVRDRLCEFRGVGRKVADCVALFSLDRDDAIPVDTHVWKIAVRDYDPEGTLQSGVRLKSLTPSNYQRVGDLFRGRFPNRAGWAHSLLFVAELPSFRGLLPEALVEEMDEFQREEKERKKLEKEQQRKEKQQRERKRKQK